MNTEKGRRHEGTERQAHSVQRKAIKKGQRHKGTEEGKRKEAIGNSKYRKGTKAQRHRASSVQRKAREAHSVQRKAREAPSVQRKAREAQSAKRKAREAHSVLKTPPLPPVYPLPANDQLEKLTLHANPLLLYHTDLDSNLPLRALLGILTCRG